MKLLSFVLSIPFSLCVYLSAHAQLITGYWKGKIDRKNVEVKIIKNGDSLTGTSYYYESKNNYRRYSIKGYFSSIDNSVVWWDDMLLEEKGNRKLWLSKSTGPYYSTTDFNCPGGTKMYLNGNAALKNDEEQNRPVALEKSDAPLFPDEWDYIVDNYTIGANDPELIDSIGHLALYKQPPVAPTVAMATPPPTPKASPVKTSPKKEIPVAVIKKQPTAKQEIVKVAKPVAAAPLTNEQKFNTRSRKLMQEIAISGDSIELHFYDNAEVDGDSIAIFLNNTMLYQHVRLTDKPYTIKLEVATLLKTNELVMVAENLGSIPPNTSLMIAQVNGIRYEARLESTEHSSALIKFVKP